ncbi:MAG TPA: CDP-alcohol phosphatidyltransferase family protein, partial [Leptospiraceae bacterium]|nr:CDP-alcohol phosphatidyltransferase family protein [Leptospiraceae bacterium]HMY65499.1 CDP-alcohol phosphatidyltransferase family protein [Leptospiraceae bacterium]HNF16953.1 CDP-alcohol phosphatidyltransferase family protein [Leptospiraceae bacterium]HNI98069.1 CDP-alcohol phosphatidyltransferase family protein [Leptospiraceae bacterium]HNM04611.1 CDP-alcohol phosphatidyltransferase family protein [Leptospiraceae bacterium]
MNINNDSAEKSANIRKRLETEKLLILPNVISSVRVFLLPFFLFFGRKYSTDRSILHLVYIYLLFFIMSASDILDGFVARKLRQETVFGKYMDPVCDKITAILSLLMLSLYYSFPWILFYLVFLREILGTAVGTVLFFRYKVQGNPNFAGKLTVWASGFTILWYISSYEISVPEQFLHIPAWLLFSVYVYAALGYLISFRNEILKADQNSE